MTLRHQLVLRAVSFRERSVNVTLPESRLALALPADMTRWAMAVQLHVGTRVQIRWGGPQRQVVGIALTTGQMIRMDAIEYPSVISQEIWLEGDVNTQAEVTEILAI